MFGSLGTKSCRTAKLAAAATRLKRCTNQLRLKSDKGRPKGIGSDLVKAHLADWERDNTQQASRSPPKVDAANSREQPQSESSLQPLEDQSSSRHAASADRTSDGEQVINEGDLDAGQVIAKPEQTRKRPPPSRPLPISPLMDPSFYAAKQKHRTPKARPTRRQAVSGGESPTFKNIYALALATPLRRCQATQVMLPQFFLQKFNAVKSPVDGMPWMMPRDLAPHWNDEGDGGGGRKVSPHEGAKTRSWDPSTAEEGSVVEDGTESDRMSDASPPRSSPSIGTNYWIVRSHTLIESFSGQNKPTKKGKYKDKRRREGQEMVTSALPHQFLKNGRFDTNNATRKSRAMIQWRPDMADLMLKMMRREIFSSLVYLVGLKRGYVQHGLPRQSPGAVLWFGDSGKGVVSSILEDAGRIPCYDMRQLLGEPGIQALKEKVPLVFDTEIIGIRKKNATSELLSRLWQLDMYVAGRVAGEGEPIDPKLSPNKATLDVGDDSEQSPEA